MATKLQLPEQHICNLYTSGVHNTVTLSDLFNVSNVTIGRILERNGISRSDHSKAKRTHSLHANYFDVINTPEKAYWLGFIAADGNVYRTVFSVAQSEKDEYHINRLASALCYNGPLKRYSRVTDTGYISNTVKLSIGSKEIVMALQDHGIVPNKSLVYQAWRGPKYLMPHYWRGYLDGDGCITYSQRDRGKGPYSGWRVKVVGNLDVLEDMKCHINYGGSISRQYNSWSLYYSGRPSVVRVGESLEYYSDNISLDRKKDLFKQVRRELNA